MKIKQTNTKRTENICAWRNKNTKGKIYQQMLKPKLKFIILGDFKIKL